ncbi:MAG: hypothetical protein ACPL7K_00240, partial [Armatimonadota bacterium]
ATNLIACVCNDALKTACTDIDTGVALQIDTYYKLTMWSDTAGVISMSINDGTPVTFTNPSTLPNTTKTLQPHFIMGRTGGTGTRSLYLDFFAARRAVTR